MSRSTTSTRWRLLAGVPAVAMVAAGMATSAAGGSAAAAAPAASSGNSSAALQQSWINYASLAFGVTTIHDPSNDTGEIFASSEMAKSGMIVAPRIFSTGTILYGAKAPFKADINSLDDALAHLRLAQSIF